MSWTLEQAANDLERYVIQGEPPSVDAAAMMIAWARMGVVGRPTCRNIGDDYMFKCSECGAEFEPVAVEGNEYGDVFYTPLKPLYCSACGAKVVE